jgi:hypothetical protein
VTCVSVCAQQGGVPASASASAEAATSSSAATVEARQGRLMEEAHQLAEHIIPTVLRELAAVQEATASDQSYVVMLEAEVRRRGVPLGSGRPVQAPSTAPSHARRAAPSSSPSRAPGIPPSISPR